LYGVQNEKCAKTYATINTIAQKLDTAIQPDMPETAIASGCIDFFATLQLAWF
jgi:chemotaxis response regulator CheB